MTVSDARPVRVGIRVTGLVQGVGFRPHVYALAVGLGLAGWVGNDSDGVFIEVEGGPAAVADFRERLVRTAPPLAAVDRVLVSQLAASGDPGFAIVPSRGGAEPGTLISPDTATCEDCLRELFDPADRRFRYPFINCTNCGPRFTIVRNVPYDRPATTMAGFMLCEECAGEYRDPTNRRFHAQPVCCAACGPRLRLTDGQGTAVTGDPLTAAARLLDQGRILAIKGLGGYHLAADASCADAVAALRARKHREDRPFALMAPDLAGAAELCVVGEVERDLLTSAQRPIVLLDRRDSSASGGPTVAHQVAPGNRSLGIMLPYTPMHHLLCREFGRPFVLTSGNISDEPIVYRDRDAARRLGGIADFFLTHDRPIQTRVDDSVFRVFGGAQYPIRRSRGYAPSPTPVREPFPLPVLACGAELKCTFCLGKGERAFVSHHIGDLANHETLRSYVEGIEHFSRMFDVRPRLVAHDLHPDYLSTKYALELADTELVGVQHHHAHVASCMAEHGESGPVIGVAFDGLGYGADGTLWGGEFLIADLARFRRVGHLAPVPMPGGEAAIREPWRMAASYLDAAYGEEVPAGLAVAGRSRERWDPIVKLSRSQLNAPLTSSAGRLFDAVAALIGVRDAVTFEGQAAIELEQRVDIAERSGYPVPVGADGVVDSRVLIRSVVADLRAGVATATIAGRFHNGLADMVVDVCRRLRAEHGLCTVALSGGVFQNMVLLNRIVEGLAGDHFKVLVHRLVPTNDGGISFGQAAVASARARAGAGTGSDADTTTTPTQVSAR